jgi:pyrophosphate--fructose-6-phosphate 1-phosphotransferase
MGRCMSFEDILRKRKLQLSSTFNDLSQICVKELPTKPIDISIEKFFPATKNRKDSAVARGAPVFRKIKKVAVVFSGGPAPGGHDVIAGLFDTLKRIDPEIELWGGQGGFKGLLTNDFVLLQPDRVDRFRNMGGFDLIGTGRSKLETIEQLQLTAKN